VKWLFQVFAHYSIEIFAGFFAILFTWTNREKFKRLSLLNAILMLDAVLLIAMLIVLFGLWF